MAFGSCFVNLLFVFLHIKVKIEEYIGLQTANTNMLNYLDWIVKHEE